MAKICIYHASDQDKEDFAELSKNNEVKFFDGPLTAQGTDPGVEIISVFVGCDVNEKTIKSMPKLKFIACRSTGYNNVDLAAAAKDKITVSNVPTYGEHTVAEYTLGLMLALSRKLLDAVEQARVGEINANLVHGHDLNGKTLGIIGLGKIGQNVARLGKAFGMKILAYDPFPNEKTAKDIGIEFVSLEKLLASADIVSLHAPLNRDNHHMIGKEELASMKRGSILINTSRGELVDTLALVDALQSGHLAGAAIDVIEDESLLDVEEEEMLLRKGRTSKRTLENAMAIDVLTKMMHNVIITSHNAYNTLEALQRINNTTVENIEAFLSGNPKNVVTK